jgi:hypothetical protein
MNLEKKQIYSMQSKADKREQQLDLLLTYNTQLTVTDRSLEVFAAAEFKEIFSDRQHEDVKVFRRIEYCLSPHIQGVACGLVETKWKIFTSAR